MAVGGRKGQVYPSNTRIHRTLPAPFDKDGTITIATPITILVPIAGDNYTRIYFKASKAGTLKFQFVRPFPESAVYDTKAVVDVTTVADIEKLVDIPVEGESQIKITFTPDATGTISYCDVCHNWGI